MPITIQRWLHPPPPAATATLGVLIAARLVPQPALQRAASLGFGLWRQSPGPPGLNPASAVRRLVECAAVQRGGPIAKLTSVTGGWVGVCVAPFLLHGSDDHAGANAASIFIDMVMLEGERPSERSAGRSGRVAVAAVGVMALQPALYIGYAAGLLGLSGSDQIWARLCAVGASGVAYGLKV